VKIGTDSATVDRILYDINSSQEKTHLLGFVFDCPYEIYVTNETVMFFIRNGSMSSHSFIDELYCTIFNFEQYDKFLSLISFK
jgi:hypothetical protein